MKVQFYVQISPEGKLVRASQRYPYGPVGGCIVTKVTLEIDPAVLRPLEPKGTVGAGAVRVIPLQTERPEESTDGE